MKVNGPGFLDREDAGRQLADAIAGLATGDPGLRDPVVLALPRGGLPLAAIVAERLDCPLDLVLVRKLGLPSQPELAAGALVDGTPPEAVYNPDVLDAAGLTEVDLEPVKARQLEEIERRRTLYRQGRAPEPVTGRDVIVIDDGIATGATARAALRGLRRMKPSSLTLAVPVAPADTAERLKREVDHLICLELPIPFFAVGAHYRDFSQVSDEEVAETMRAAWDRSR